MVPTTRNQNKARPNKPIQVKRLTLDGQYRKQVVNDIDNHYDGNISQYCKATNKSYNVIRKIYADVRTYGTYERLPKIQREKKPSRCAVLAEKCINKKGLPCPVRLIAEEAKRRFKNYRFGEVRAALKELHLTSTQANNVINASEPESEQNITE